MNGKILRKRLPIASIRSVCLGQGNQAVQPTDPLGTKEGMRLLAVLLLSTRVLQPIGDPTIHVQRSPDKRVHVHLVYDLQSPKTI